MRRPRPRAVIDYGPVREAAEELMDEYASDDFCEDLIGKLEAHLVEQAFVAIYGDKVFDWINEKLT